MSGQKIDAKNVDTVSNEIIKRQVDADENIAQFEENQE